ncbi:NMD protein affecting ribosome stability and mRNA decay [Penicillium longicatenatum]|uniref:NMD protein affecting ribosome stability and mRNA decay n=1 Tax=Penicillium longicatenatum TaxID=1561947 RepID=UPI0025485ADA|nr:NMD protein affecting ribosome stability and mRNA decay [Penicillium longicatenatum]KAJ5639443.1 NMD protein affecting ribosome stability and mRNA decay [Penicillium longicatenatum]KAJ5652115.1 NMD protein affecting ribosome stability and mRNA decay [Penicillium longicatenatum]
MSMDLDAPVYMTGLQDNNVTATILCCNCGAPIDGTTSAGALCQDCLRLNVDVSQGIQREGTLHCCRDCERWLQPPNSWVVANPESKELLAVCLRRLRGLSKVRIIDASFIWTEPHSRRVKVKITIQQEAFQGTIIQQTFEVEYVVASQQCDDCKKSYTHNTWRAAVQVRQKVPHKRTFLYLEQLILKNGAHKDTVNIKEAKDGLDFYFAQRNHAEKMVDFLASVVPCKTKKSQELISMDIHTSTKSYKFTFSVEIIPICKDDLVALPIKLARQIGNILPLTLCYRVGTSINLLDPTTLQTSDVPTGNYWRNPFKNLADVTELKEFIVMDIEPTGQSNGKFHLAEATVARASDLGSNDITYFTRTHLGGVLHVGDSVLGYHLSGTLYNNDNYEALEASSQYSSTLPDVVLVRKHYARKKKPKNRAWRLKRMAREYEAEEASGVAQKSRREQNDANRLEEDFETFLRDVEEDPELRHTLDLYKVRKERQAADAMDEDEDNESDDGVPEINMEELLDDFDELNMDGE